MTDLIILIPSDSASMLGSKQPSLVSRAMHDIAEMSHLDHVSKSNFKVSFNTAKEKKIVQLWRSTAEKGQGVGFFNPGSLGNSKL